MSDTDNIQVTMQWYWADFVLGFGLGMALGIIMLICGLLPKIGAIIASMPLPVLGGGVIVMFGMVAAAGMNVLSEVSMTRRNMIIIAISLTVGLGLNLVPSAVQHLPGIWKTLATSAVAPTAFLAIMLNQILPEEE